MSWDPYVALGVPRSATADEVRRAYRRLAKELHPDVRPGDKAAEDKFKQASAAFNLLSDPVQKARFDRGEIDADGNERMGFGARGYGQRPGGQSGSGHPGAGQGPYSAEAPFDLGDIFSDLFGSGAGPRGYGRMRGRDLRVALDVDFLDAANGAKRRVQLAEGRTLEIAIPRGVESGQVLRLKGQGAPGAQGGQAGDAFIEVRIRPHAYFRRDGDNILMDLPISLTEAAEGAKIPVPTLSGLVQLSVPPNSSSGARLRLKGKGVNDRGDLIVQLQIMLPDSADEEMKKFLKKWPKREWKPARPGS